MKNGKDLYTLVNGKMKPRSNEEIDAFMEEIESQPSKILTLDACDIEVTSLNPEAHKYTYYLHRKDKYYFKNHLGKLVFETDDPEMKQLKYYDKVTIKY